MELTVCPRMSFPLINLSPFRHYNYYARIVYIIQLISRLVDTISYHSSYYFYFTLRFVILFAIMDESAFKENEKFKNKWAEMRT